jgi:alkylresorcinol/alkylpyrone synthase
MFHAGGVTILDAIRDALHLPESCLASSRAVLKRCGNMSSPTILFVLAEELASAPPRAGEWGLLASFGAGFSAHAVLARF